MEYLVITITKYDCSMYYIIGWHMCIVLKKIYICQIYEIKNHESIMKYTHHFWANKTSIQNITHSVA